MKYVQIGSAAALFALTGALSAQEPTTAEKPVVTRCRSSNLLGADLKNAAKENLGDIEDIVLDAGSRRIAYVVVSYGGFLGMGDKLFALPWGQIAFTQRGANEAPLATLALDKETLKKSPGFDKNKWPDFADRTWAKDVDAYYAGKGAVPHVTDGVIDGNGSADKSMKDAKDPETKSFRHRRLTQVVGVDVYDPGRRSLGEIEDVIVDMHKGAIDGMVVAYGGVLGMGEKLVLVPFESLTLDAEKDTFVLATSKARLDAVAFSHGKWPTLNDDKWLDGGRAYFKTDRVDTAKPNDEAPVAFRDHYDVKKTETITGAISSLGTVRVGDERDDRLRLRVSVDDGREVVVYAAPRDFAEQAKCAFRPGMRVEIVGSRAEYFGRTVLVAGTIKSADGSKVVRLRDDEGRPRWALR
jgi:sporulation protein YlmC with PRC-barrel domain